MSKYTFVVCGGISLHVGVEADSLDEAVEKAQSASIAKIRSEIGANKMREILKEEER